MSGRVVVAPCMHQFDMHMSRKVPRTYDEISRNTVPEPDSGFRPTLKQLHETREGMWAMDDDEKALAARVDEALIEEQLDEIGLEVQGTRVILRGPVADMKTMERIEEIVSGIDGVGKVDNHLYVPGPG